MFRTTALFAALAAATATISFPAYADEPTQATEVHYSDLNLASADGAQALKGRVARAVKRVCAIDGDNSLQAWTEARNCSKVAMARAMPQVELALANAGARVAQSGHVSVAAH